MLPGNPEDITPKPETKLITLSAYSELGVTGLKHYSGTLYEEWLPALAGPRGVKVYTEMSENDPIIGASLFAIESLLRSVAWAVEPAVETPEAIEMAEFVEECMNDMSHTWEDFISEILTMVRYGWSYHEVVYKRRQGEDGETPSRYRDGLIGWRKFAPRSQDTLYRWKIQADGGIDGMWQYPPPTGVETNDAPHVNRPYGGTLIFIPIEKALLFRTTSAKSSPEGRSLLRTAYRPWYFSKRIEEVEALGLERDLAGIPTALVPIEILADNPSPEAATTLRYIKDVVRKTKRDETEGIVFPLAYDESGNKLYEFSLLSTGGRRSFDTGAIVQRYSQQKAQAVLADFILLGHESVGSFALSSDKTEMFAVALGSILDSIEDVLNRHAVPRLLKLNGLPVDELMPQFRHGDIEKPDLAALIQFVQGLANAGAPLFPDLVLENHLRGIADLPAITEEEREQIMSQQAEQMAAMQPQMPGLGIGGPPTPGGPGGGAGGPGQMAGFPGAKPPAQPPPTAQAQANRPLSQPQNKDFSTVQKAAERLIDEVLA